MVRFESFLYFSCLLLQCHSFFVLVNPFKQNGISHSNKLDHLISILRVVWWYFSLLFNFYRTFYRTNSGDPDQRPHSTQPESALLAFVPQKGCFALK